MAKILETRMAVESARLDQRPIAAGRTARGVLQGVAGRAVFFVFGYLATIVLARGLGPADYGIYGVILSVLVWVEKIARFTIAPAAAKLIPEEGERSSAVEQTALFLNFFLCLLLFALFWIAAPLLADLFRLPAGTTLFRLAALDLPFFGTYVMYCGVLQGRREFYSIAVAESLYSAVKLACVLSLLVIGFSVTSALIANVLTSVGALLFVMSRTSIKMLKPAYTLVRPLIRLALPFGLYMSALQTVSSVDLWFLKALSPSQEAATIGLYVAARNMAIVPSVILMVISDVLLPSLSGALAQNDTQLSRRYLQGSVRFLWITVPPIALLLMLTAQEVMSFLFSSSFGAGSIYLRILTLYAVSLAFMDLFASALNAHGEPYLSGATLFLLIPMALFLNIFLIPSYGAIGAAYASALVGLAGAVTLGMLVYKRFGSLIRLRTFLNGMLAVLLMAGIASQFTVTGPLLAIFYLGCLGIYGLGLVLLGEVTGKDLEPFAFWRSRLK